MRHCNLANSPAQHSSLSSVPFGPINNIEQTFAHPHVAARQMISEVEVREDHIWFAVPRYLISLRSTHARARLSWSPQQ